MYWNYKNIRKGDNDYFSKDGSKVMLHEGYWTFNQLKKRMSDNNIQIEEYPDAGK